MPDQPPTPDEEQDGASRGPLGRLLRMSGRAKLLVAVGLVLVLIYATQSCRGVDITEEQAVATARNALAADPGAFEPARTEAKVLRQGFPPAPMWVVVFSVPDPDGGSDDFLHKADVWVHASTGQLEQVIVHEPDEG